MRPFSLGTAEKRTDGRENRKAMLKYYMILGVPYPATDEQIRQAYLDMVKRFPPERNAEEFARISEAYEALKDETHRIHAMLDGFVKMSYPEDEIVLLGRLSRLRAGGIGLMDLIDAERGS